MEVTFWEMAGAFLAFFFLVAVTVLAGVFLGAWFVFRTKFAGTGYSLKLPTEPKQAKQDGKTDSYVSDLYRDLGESTILADEPLSPAAMRIREQKVGEPAEYMKAVMARVTGKEG